MHQAFKWFFTRAGATPSVFRRLVAVLAASLMLLTPLSAAAGGRLRDAEIERALRTMSTPIFQSAGLEGSAVKIYLINDSRLNAFVAGGQNIFIHSGLILSTEDVGQLLGAIAHETGHIEGGHLLRGKDALMDAQLGSVVGMVLGVAATLAGAQNAGMGAMAAGQQIAMNSFLGFTRTQENAADQAAMRYLDATHTSAEGMLHLFEIMRQREKRQFGMIDPYSRTHPLTQDRISAARSHLMRSSIPKGQVDESYQAMYARMVAKLRAFLEPPEYVDRYYKAEDNSLAAQMARAIQAFKQHNWELAHERLTAMLKQYPQDGFLYDLAGQIAFETSHVEEAAGYYAKAVALQPNEAQIAADYARTLLSRKAGKDVQTAVLQLERATSLERDYSPYWELLARAYGMNDDKGRAGLAQAAQLLLQGEPEAAMRSIREAEKYIPQTGPLPLRAQDLRRQADDLKRQLLKNS